MKRAWHEANGELFKKTIAEIESGYPDLRVVLERGSVYARGSFPVKDGSEILDRFRIELKFPNDYPDSILVLRETGGRIPWFSDRHVNPDGEACPIVPEEWLLRTDRDSVTAFLEGPVRNFFLGQILIEHGKPWPFGERKHGKSGLIESYGELVETNDPDAIRRHLDCLSRDTLKGHWECPCGSGKRLRNCHLTKLKILHQKIPSWVAKRALKRFDSM